MPRLVEERWVGIGFDVVEEQGPVVENGQPMFDGLGQPKMQQLTTLVLVVALPDGQRIVRIPFEQATKNELVRKLTCGIVIANGHVA